MPETSVFERRITIRLIAYWEKLRRQNPMPTESDIDPDDLHDLWDYCFLIHTQDINKPDYNYTYLGKAISQAYQGELEAGDKQLLVSPNAGKLSESYRKVVEMATPLVEEGEFHNLNNDVVKYRQCLLPLGSGDRVEAIFGGMRFKVFSREDEESVN